MKNLTITVCLAAVLGLLVAHGCVTSNVKVTDKRTGNSVEISDDGVAIDVKTIETEDIAVEMTVSEQPNTLKTSTEGETN